ncbi:hypothetical protein INP48_02325 [Xanthomonas perforans]|uniref:hypothetical protein n=1 Tax=Xanthomonas perforans TaxID=442694 RepID=UPI000FFE9670|nr:hypothetical protein [Xanthomonas perforans]MBZ2436934.1 hypothetical protein [Xanthomonas perforans]NEL38416.1 hypothetical protein [Xanthomonas perforans]
MIVDFAELTPVAAQVKKDLDRYSVKKPTLVFTGGKRIGYFIETALPLKELTFDGHLLNGDSCLIVELGQRHAVEGYALRDLYAWL